MTYRAVRIKGLPKDLILTKATVLKHKTPRKNLFYLEEMADGTWRMTYTIGLGDCQDLKKIIFEEPNAPIAKGKPPVAIKFDGWGKELPFTKINRISRKTGIIYMDEQPDGNWSLLFSEEFPDLRKGFEMEIIRED